MEGVFGLLAVAVVLALVVGPILGIIAFFGHRHTRDQLDILQRELRDLRARLSNMEAGGPIPPRAVAPSPVQPAAHAGQVQPRTIDETLAAMADITRHSAPPAPEQPTATPTPAQPSTTEQPTISEPSSAPVEESIAAREAEPELTAPPEETIAPPQPQLQPAPAAPAPHPGFVPAGAMLKGIPRPTFEMNLGIKWLNWIGAVFMILCVAFGLKYAYDSGWIGPIGRLAIGTLCGIACIVLGEHFRRKNWMPLFQTLTGLGLAIFYVCIFFSYQVYHLSAAGPAFILAICVTALAVALAVFHNTISIAILAVIGGFLSPVLLSTGENHPYILFTYVATLNLVAMGAAYFRRWHALEILCFAGTALMMSGWHEKFGHSAGQMTPALIFISVFYLMFLLIPTIHTMVRGLPDSREGTVLVVFNALFSALMYYRVLYPAHQHALGFVLVGQAALVILLFRAWISRVGPANNTSHSLLVIALALVIGAVPLHVSRYGIPIVWALEGALLVYVGLRYRSIWTRSMGTVALFLSVGGLLYRMPLHHAAFTPVANVPFGSWALVAAAILAGSWLHWNRTPVEDQFRALFSGATFLLGFALVCLLLSAELISYWQWNYTGNYREHYTLASLVVLWAGICAAYVTTLYRADLNAVKWQLLAAALHVIAGLVFLGSLADYRIDSTRLFLNAAFLPRLVFIVALWWAAWCIGRLRNRDTAPVYEVAGFVALAIVLALEFPRWSHYSETISHRLAFSMISVAWALEAFGLIWYGLATRRRLRRILGFLLFGIVVVKVLLIDTSELERVYRILSFGGTGVLLLAAGYFFQKYSAMLLAESEPEQPSEG